jgi:hypothetical protein
MARTIKNSKTVLPKHIGYGTLGGAGLGAIQGLGDDQSFFGGVTSGAIHGAMFGAATGVGRGMYRGNFKSGMVHGSAKRKAAVQARENTMMSRRWGW